MLFYQKIDIVNVPVWAFLIGNKYGGKVCNNYIQDGEFYFS